MRTCSLLLCIVGGVLTDCAGSAGKHGASSATDLPIGRATASSGDSGAPAGERSTSVPALAAPPAQPLDTTLEAPGPCWLRSADETHAWLDCARAQLGDVSGGYSVVLDLASGCLTESYGSPVLITQLAKLDRGPFTGGRVKEDPDPRTILDLPGAYDDLRRYMGFAYRFGERQREGWAWSADGRVVAVAISGTLLRSLDGGRTFDTADDDQNDRHFAVQPLVTADGRWLVYWRSAVSASGECLLPRSLVALASAGRESPFAFNVDAAMLKGLDASGNKLVVTRVEGTDNVCVDHADPASKSMTRSFCIPTRAEAGRRPRYARHLAEGALRHVRPAALTEVFALSRVDERGPRAADVYGGRFHDHQRP